MIVTVEPLKPYVDALLKGITVSQSLLSGGQDPHLSALTPSQATALKNADIIIIPAESMSPKLARVLADKKKEGASVIELVALPGADPLPYAAPNPWLEAKKRALATPPDQARVHDEHGHSEHAHELDHNHAEQPVSKDDKTFDPHLWLDPIRMALIAKPLATELGKNAPSYRATFLANAESLARHLREEVDPALRVLLTTPRNNPPLGNKPFVPFLTYHSAYHYFLERYRLASAGYLLSQPDTLRGAATTRDHLEAAESIALRCLVSEADTSLVKRIADISGARMVLLNPERGYATEEVPIVPWAKNDYDRLLYKVAASFGSCL